MVYSISAHDSYSSHNHPRCRSVSMYLEHQEYIEQEILFENIIETIKNKFKDSRFLKSLDQKLENNQQKFKKKIRELESELKSNDIDVDQIRTQINQSVKSVITKVRTVKTAAEGGKILAQEIPGLFGTIKSQTFGQKIATVSKGILIALLLFIIVLFLNGFIAGFIIGYLHVGMGMAIEVASKLAVTLTVVFAAPLTEEVSKYLSIKFNATGQFWFIFNAYEFLYYVTVGLVQGLSLAAVVIIRTLVVMMHSITTYIVFKYRHSNEDGTPSNTKLGLLAGIIIHFFWNLGTTIQHITFS